MPITSGSLASVYASLDAYLTAQLRYADGSPISLRLHGQRRFVPPAELPWVEVHYELLGIRSSFRNRLTRTASQIPLIATERSGVLQLDLHQRARVFSRRYTLASIRDRVVGVFAEGEVVDIQDFDDTNGPPSLAKLGAIIVDEVTEHQTETGVNSGVIAYTIQVAVRYLEVATRSV
jgi:hypothetical protein